MKHINIGALNAAAMLAAVAMAPPAQPYGERPPRPRKASAAKKARRRAASASRARNRR
jgi:hypothetical protein